MILRAYLAQLWLGGMVGRRICRRANVAGVVIVINGIVQHAGLLCVYEPD
ncbi:hypothetical protein [Azospirillum argentinense]